MRQQITDKELDDLMIEIDLERDRMLEARGIDPFGEIPNKIFAPVARRAMVKVLVRHLGTK